jgi:hypothetical protein
VRLVQPPRVGRLLAEGVVRACLGDVLRAQEDDGVARTSASVFSRRRCLPFRSAVLAWSLGHELLGCRSCLRVEARRGANGGLLLRERLIQKG